MREKVNMCNSVFDKKLKMCNIQYTWDIAQLKGKIIIFVDILLHKQ